MPCMINKGIIKSFNSPLLRNSEGVSVNQVKSDREILLKDNTSVPWIVIYLAKGTLTDPNLPQVTIPLVSPDYTLSGSIEDWDLYKFRLGGDENTKDYVTATTVNINYNYKHTGEVHLWDNDMYSYQATVSLIGDGLVESGMDQGNTSFSTNLSLDPRGLATVKSHLDELIGTNYTNTIITRAIDLFNVHRLADLIQYDGKIIKDSLNKLYQIKVVQVSNPVEEVQLVYGPPLYNTLTEIWNNAAAQSVVPGAGAITVSAPCVNYRIEISEVSSANMSFILNRLNDFVSDSPLFDVIALPYGEINYTTGNSGVYANGSYTTSATKSMMIANAIGTQLTSSRVLDIQLLPYCPVWIPKGSEGSFTDVGAYMLTGTEIPTMVFDNAASMGIVLEGNDHQDMIFGVKHITSTFNISQPVSAGSYKHAVSIGDSCRRVKYVNDCTMVRLCSPNYAGVFEFNLAKNGMSVESFNVDMTLRPFNPYIHVNPNFKMLYGTDTDDARGLICGGDFSLGVLNDQWKQYELQNKNYQAIFDRQIQNLDVTQDIQRVQAWAGLFGGAAQGAASGAAIGAFAGGGVIGAAVGGALGGAASAIGGAADLAMLDKAQKEQRSYMQDNFKLQLGNVKALPTTITKTSALTANNKIFPFIELYECTETERDAFLDKIEYDGMTVDAIGKMNTYVTLGSEKYEYIQCRIIRYPTNLMNISNHEIDELNNELMKGVYI